MKTRSFNHAFSRPWAITPEALQMILDIASREHIPDFEAVAAKRSRRLDGSESARIREGGVAVIDVNGPIFRYANLFTEISGGASVEILSKDFNTALNDPSIKAILLNVDSPGGEVTGICEFSQMIFVARAKKPITAYVGGLGASAAYWIASAAGEIVADATAMLGSIGIVAAVPNPEKRSARDVEFVSSQSPRKRPNPNTESGRDQIQRMVDDLAEVFVSAVARNRGVSVERVLSDFGEGGVFVGQKAVKAGLADRLGSFEKVVSELAAGRSAHRFKAKMTLAEIEAENERMRKQLAPLRQEPAKTAIIEAPSPAPMTDVRRRELLNASGLGRRILQSEKSKRSI